MGRVAHVTVAERRPQLIRAAIDVMTRDGVAAGSTRAIANEAGVAQANVHYVFGSKEQLYGDVIEHLTGDLVAQVRDAAPETSDFTEALSVLTARLWQTVRETPGTHKLLIEMDIFALRSAQLRSYVEANRRAVTEATAALIEEAAQRAHQPLARPATALARHFLAGFDGLVLSHMSLADDDAEWTYLEELVASIAALATGQLTPVNLREAVERAR
jgi:AcrR family transcriptional regulator